MNVVWIVVGLGVSAVVAAMVRRRWSDRPSDLGFVSHHWVAEQRLSEQHDTQR